MISPDCTASQETLGQPWRQRRLRISSAPFHPHAQHAKARTGVYKFSSDNCSCSNLMQLGSQSRSRSVVQCVHEKRINLPIICCHPHRQLAPVAVPYGPHRAPRLGFLETAASPSPSRGCLSAHEATRLPRLDLASRT